MQGGPKPLIEKTQKTYYKGQMILKMPLNSGGGHLYFTKTNKLQVQFFRIVSSDNQINNPFNGYYEFIDMITYKYKKIKFKEGIRQASINTNTSTINTIQNTSIIKSTETWLGAFFRCLVTHIIAIPKRDIYGEWQCYGFGGGSSDPSEVDEVNSDLQDGGGGFDCASLFLFLNPPNIYTPNPIPDPTIFWDPYLGGGGTYPTNPPDEINPIPPFSWTFSGDDGTNFIDLDPSKEPFFQFDALDNYELIYPRFTSMVKNLKTFVKNNPKVLSALQRYSGFTKQKILDYLTFGQGPTIKIEEMSGRFGYFNKNVSSSTIYIRASYIRGLELAHFQSTQDATSFLLAVTILHEFVHFGTNKNNINEGEYDFGNGFEKDAFNIIVDETNAGKIVIRFK